MHSRFAGFRCPRLMRALRDLAILLFLWPFFISATAATREVLSSSKVLLGISLEEADAVASKIIPNRSSRSGSLERSLNGAKLFLPLKVSTNGTVQKCVAEISGDGLRIISEDAFEAKDLKNDQLLNWISSHQPNEPWIFKRRFQLPNGTNVVANFGNWIVLRSSAGATWLAPLTEPAEVTSNLNDALHEVWTFEGNGFLYVFSRKSYRNADGPMVSHLFGLKGGKASLVKKSEIPWARWIIEMDPEAAKVVINDNGWLGRTWILDLGTGKRKSISQPDWIFVVKNDVADCWQRLSR
jgi:hypothetical protein